MRHVFSLAGNRSLPFRSPARMSRALTAFARRVRPNPSQRPGRHPNNVPANRCAVGIRANFLNGLVPNKLHQTRPSNRLSPRKRKQNNSNKLPRTNRNNKCQQGAGR